MQNLSEIVVLCMCYVEIIRLYALLEKYALACYFMHNVHVYMQFYVLNITYYVYGCVRASGFECHLRGFLLKTISVLKYVSASVLF